MKVLFLNSTIPNYVIDGLFHGLRSISGIAVVDIPRLDYMYLNACSEDLIKTGSKGNTLYKLLPESIEAQGKRTFWQIDVDQYDYIIFTDIFQQSDLFHHIYHTIHPKKRNTLCIVDGYDASTMFPFFNNSFNIRIKPWTYLYKFSKATYFKREYENTGSLFGVSRDRFRTINRLFSQLLKKPIKFFPISMSIPEEHIEYIPFKGKHQNFVNYNVDQDLNDLFPERPLAEIGKWQPAFRNQNEYYEEIKKSRFGITTKRAGWDCLRHYEYAAKGAILCFKNLENKHPLCAPFELNETNCIPYRNKEDLLNKINTKSTAELENIHENQYEWIKKYTTKKVASRFLDQLIAANTNGN